MNFTINGRYFRFSGSFQTCKLFVLLLYSFEDTLLAVHKSGFSSSDDALFLIQVNEITSTDFIINSYMNELFTYDSELYHAPLAFFEKSTSSKRVGLHCYFCPEKLGISHMTSLMQIGAIIEQTSSQGYQRKLKLRTTQLDQAGFPRECILSLEELQLRQPFYAALKSCFDETHLIASSHT